jgi:hypothetical protein
LSLLRSKAVSGKLDPTPVYVELLAQHRDSGLIEIVSEADHSFAAGYIGERGLRTWRERLALLERRGFIKTKAGGNTKYKHVLLVHPSVPVQKLRDAGTVPDVWWDTYRTLQIQVKETRYEDIIAKKEAAEAAAAVLAAAAPAPAPIKPVAAPAVTPAPTPSPAPNAALSVVPVKDKAAPKKVIIKKAKP